MCRLGAVSRTALSKSLVNTLKYKDQLNVMWYHGLYTLHSSLEQTKDISGKTGEIQTESVVQLISG